MLNAMTYLDMAIRARPSSDTPSQAVEQLAHKTGAQIPGADGQLVVLGLTKPGDWSSADWASDIAPRLDYGGATYAPRTALDKHT